jgi:hypothetical protein
MLRKIDFEHGVLKTEDHIYRISKSISVKRYKEFELMQTEVAYGYTFKDIEKSLTQVREELNKLKFVDASVTLDNLMSGIKRGLERENNVTLKMCALFMLREDEKAADYDEALQQEKIKDWEDVDIADFFELAMNLIPGLLSAYRKISQSISKGAENLMMELLNTTEKEKSE